MRVVRMVDREFARNLANKSALIAVWGSRSVRLIGDPAELPPKVALRGAV
jgi:hypothetical protein